MEEQVDLSEILISARLESHRMRHFFIGVEHLFIALLELRGGLMSHILADEGQSSEFVADLIRRKVGKGGRTHHWTGIPNTPRANVVLDIAHEVALSQGRREVYERDLLMAIFEERDNLCMRVLKALKLDLDALRKQVQTRPLARAVSQTFLAIVFAPDFEGGLVNDQLYILRRMFHGYAQLRIEARLTGGYTSAEVLVATPIRVDGREDASVVAKIDHKDAIIEEAQRYERFVKNTLPPLTARLEDKPTAPDISDLAGLKYTLITDSEGKSRTIRAVLREWSGDRIGQWLSQRLFHTFGAKWWQQRTPYRFAVWQEYDHLLPPILTLEVVKPQDLSRPALILKDPIRRSAVTYLEYGTQVAVDNFAVHKVDEERGILILALGQHGSTARPYQIEVRGIDFKQDAYYRNEIVERLVGKVWLTRHEQFLQGVRLLQPDFDEQAETLPFDRDRLPNPLVFYARLLDVVIDGTLCTTHSDLHLGNIMLGQDDIPLLIDFARARDGHALFDWATLEMSLLTELVAPLVHSSWDDVRAVTRHYLLFSRGSVLPSASEALQNAFRAIQGVREVVQICLAHPASWHEYYVALTFLALRAMLWESIPLAGRRLMLYVAAAAIRESVGLIAPQGQGRGTPMDKTDVPASLD
ncbi:MAG: phosphotransferase [Anaerolineae bacterium]|nr:phosphotransferase [Anaerolineae bacterium]MDW8173292.1 Clp protease N-terminal domain-containing protein [Anaerolineae bacterium]